MGCALQFRNVTLGYDRHPAVHHLDGEVASGALVAVVGPNGAGKSTLFKGVVGLLKPLAGRIERDVVAAQDIAYLPQAAEKPLAVRRTAERPNRPRGLRGDSAT